MISHILNERFLKIGNLLTNWQKSADLTKLCSYQKYCFVLFAIFILHSRESKLYRYTLDGKSALAWELPFSRCLGHLSST